jgi:hypothetical protein
MDELNGRGLSNSHFHGAAEFNVVDLLVLLPWGFPRCSELEGAFVSAFSVPVEASEAPSREPALFLLKASVLGVEPSDSYKTARSVTLVGDLAPANASISICVRRQLG